MTRDEKNAYMREWNRRNREKVREDKRRYYQKHRVEIIARSTAWSEAHVDQRRKQRAEEYRKNKRAHRDRRLRQQFGIGVEDYERLFKMQLGSCKICGRKGTGQRGKKHLHVDHCHRTKKVRGLLCHGCNTGLGAFKDDPERLRKAAAYLEG